MTLIIRDYGHTLLIVATQSDNPQMVKYLLNNGANKELKLENGNKAIDFATSESTRKLLTQ